MKVIFEIPKDGEEDSIIVRCRHVSQEIMQLLERVKTHDTLIGYVNNEIHRINPSEIFYVETVDRKTFLYGKNSVYESKQKLYELEKALQVWSFLRVGKSLIVNMKKVKSIAPLITRCFEVVLANDEKVIVSRQYVNALKKYLGL